MAEIHADDLVAYACPDYRLDELTHDQLAGAFEARAGNIDRHERAAWILTAARLDARVRLFPQHLDERERRDRLKGTVLDPTTLF